MNNIVSATFLLQGVYYIITGLWPLLHIKSFEAVSGPKNDDWLVHTVGFLVLAVGLTLVAGFKKKSRELYILAIGSAAGLTFIDVYYSVNNVISKVYLLDAVPEIVFILIFLTSIAFKKSG